MSQLSRSAGRSDYPGPISRAGLTLVELMVSLAMVVLIVAGINAVFQATSRTISAGTAIASNIRSHQAAEAVFKHDLSRAVALHEQPLLLIISQRIYTYDDRRDMDQDNDRDPSTADPGGTGVESPIPVTDTFGRSHRIDRFAFFARDAENPFRRQTGNQPTQWQRQRLVDDLYFPYSKEAWIWYGHLRLPDNTAETDPAFRAPGNFLNPGDLGPDQNPNNYFASDWCFGRVAMLLQPNLPQVQYASDPATWISDSTTASPLAPLGVDSVGYNIGINGGLSIAYIRTFPRSTGAWRIQHSRFDVANTSIRNYPAVVNGKTQQQIDEAFDYRFNCKPLIDRTPPVSASGSSGRTAPVEKLAREMALSSPFFQRGVSQFVVEYAGDFLKQDPTSGNITGVGPDGEIDFLIPDYGGSNYGNRRIRWYGFPRNVDTTDDVGGVPMILARDSNKNKMIDVVPLTAISQSAGQACERFYQRARTGGGTVDFSLSASGLKNFATDLPADVVCATAWTHKDLNDPARGKPSMIRIVMTVTDPNGRIPDGQTMEYVYSLQP